MDRLRSVAGRSDTSEQKVLTDVFTEMKLLCCDLGVWMVRVLAWVSSVVFAVPVLAAVGVPDGVGMRLATSRLVGPRSRVVPLVMRGDGRRVTDDLSGRAEWRFEPSGIVEVREGAFVPLKDGRVMVRAMVEGVEVGCAEVEVVGMADGGMAQVSFRNEIVPIFTKTACNGGVCHGKATGQNGFKLSLFGFEPEEDYDFLVVSGRARRVMPTAPDASLLLMKGAAVIPHGGGKRLERGRGSYEVIADWMRQGMPSDLEKGSRVTRLEVMPAERVASADGTQQLAVAAHFDDGSVRDVTHLTGFESNEKGLAEVDDRGVVRMLGRPGAVAVMARYGDKMGVFRVTVPRGPRTDPAKFPLAKNFVDEGIFAVMRDAGVEPSRVCDDRTFVRRVTLDLTGRLPSEAEVSEFLGFPEGIRRERWVDRLLESAAYADHFAGQWASLLRNRRSLDPYRDDSLMHGTFSFHRWLRAELFADRPFDGMVRALLTARGGIAEAPAAAWYRQLRDMPSQIEDTAQLFMGVRMQCAQCHHHPYEQWTQRDYWALGAFFSQLQRKPSDRLGEEVLVTKRMAPVATHKRTGEAVPPSVPGGAELKVAPEDDARVALADWMCKPENPFFAKALVNRYWKHFFNRGLVEPEDDLRETNPATHPELLDRLAAEFVKGGFRLKGLCRTLVLSSAYQLSSEPVEGNAGADQYFARYFGRRLPAEVMSDAINRVCGYPQRFQAQPEGTLATQLPDSWYTRDQFFDLFGRPAAASACACERSSEASLSQSLHFLNSDDMRVRIAHPQGFAATAAKAKDPLDVSIRSLYVRALAREPREPEIMLARSYLERKLGNAEASGGDATAKDVALRSAWEDVVWGVLNTKEFLFNH